MILVRKNVYKDVDLLKMFSMFVRCLEMCVFVLKIASEILATDTQCHSECYDTVSDTLQDSNFKSSKEHNQLFTQFSV